ncbi:thiamine-phosphate kinase [Anaplasma phagocytophilum]|uniref:Thiamine-monophosphate kinase n=1 Tax=Anaplasma phagocytophilum str. ApNP TaxID=1359153 RepID=A0A0F3NJ28_ANAPH|nr:thiamine-monophosphate kinase [Anaplasma phagocytophilum str. ApNP]
MDEFQCIEKYIRPLLRSGFASENDDAAHVSSPTSSFIMTKDVLVENVHFLSHSDPFLLAKKALRVNLSDIASMGATPHSYLLGLSLPKFIDEEWWKSFCAGLQEDNSIFSIKLTGGDTTNNLADIIVISITALGIPPANILTRSNAKVGDYLYVSGTIGDAALGLLAYNKKLIGEFSYLKQRYDLPQPRVMLGTSISNVASACIDVSDGLLQDIRLLCKLSGVGANLYAYEVPLSHEATAAIMQNHDLLENVLAGGDDYELAFTVPPKYCPEIEQIATSVKIPVKKIGVITREQGIRVYDRDNNLMKISKEGYSHTFS